MRRFKTVEEVYDTCVAEGSIIPLAEVDVDRIHASLHIAEEDLQSAQDAVAKKRWNSAFKAYYNVLHQLAESYLKFEKVIAKTHLSLFAYLCVKHPELELNWDFFEKIRTKRNCLDDDSTMITEKDWKEVALEFQLYIALFKKKNEEKL